MKSKVIAWMQLLRLPNVLTVPGDVWVGMAIATSGVIFDRSGILAVLTACFLYLAGMVQNAVQDVEQDAERRPERPLPAGRISMASAHVTQRVLFNLGVACGLISGGRVVLVTCALFGCIWGYNFLKGRSAVMAVVLMGACRALSVGLGIAAAGGIAADQPWRWGIPLVWGAYIAGVTGLARRESLPGGLRPAHIGGLIRFLILMQSILLFWMGNSVLAFVLFGTAIVHVAWVKTVPAS